MDPVTLAVVAGITGLSALGKWFFGKKSAKRAKREAEKMAREQAERHKQFMEEAETRTGELYEKYKANPEEIKKQYEEAVQRALQQQAGGMTAALSSQRKVNPALAAHLLANQSADVQSKSAGDTALEQTKLGTQFDLYNTQLMQQIRNQELAYEGREEDRQSKYAEQSYIDQQRMRQAMIDGIFDTISKGTEVGMTLSGLGKNTPKDTGAGQAFSPNASNYSLNDQQMKNPWDRFSLIDNPSNPFRGSLS